MKWFLITGAMITTMTATAWAQVGPPATLAKVTVSNEVAKRTLNKMAINADTARAIVDACVQWQKQQPGNQSIAIFVLDPMGNIVDSHQMDGVLPIVVEDQLIGAVGVGGGNADEQCAYQAMEKVLGPQPPLTTATPPAGGAAPAGGGRGGRGGRGAQPQ